MSTSQEAIELALAIIRAADRRAGAVITTSQAQIRYGVVTAVDVPNRVASVKIAGMPTTSPGFAFGPVEPVVDDRVRVVLLPTGDRFIDEGFGQMRLRGSAGGTRDLVEVGTNGLVLGGDLPLSTPAANQAQIGANTGVDALMLRLMGQGADNPNTGAEVAYAGLELYGSSSYLLGKIAAVQPNARYLDSADLVFLVRHGGSLKEFVRMNANSNWMIVSQNLHVVGLTGMSEQTEPGNAAANEGFLFMKDNGSGKTQLCVKFSTGATIVLATEA